MTVFMVLLQKIQARKIGRSFRTRTIFVIFIRGFSSKIKILN